MSLPIFPASDFDAVIEAYAKNATVNAPVLAYFDFRDGPGAYWGGGYDVVFGGVTWQGIGKSGVVVSIDGLEQSGNLQASDMTFKLSGIDTDIMAAFSNEDRAAYVGRLVGVYWQFLDENWQPLCSPIALRAGIMGTMTADRLTDDKGNVTRTISLPASNIFFGRGSATSGYFTDPDQQALHPGDAFLSFVGSIQETAIRQPWR